MKGLIFTWLLTLLGVSASFIRPYHGFLVYVALAVLRPDALWSSHIQGGRFSMIVASAMLLNWFVRCCGNWSSPPVGNSVAGGPGAKGGIGCVGAASGAGESGFPLAVRRNPASGAISNGCSHWDGRQSRW